MGFFKKMNEKYEADKNRESIFFPLSDYVEPEDPSYPLDVEVDQENGRFRILHEDHRIGFADSETATIDDFEDGDSVDVVLISGKPYLRFTPYSTDIADYTARGFSFGAPQSGIPAIPSAEEEKSGDGSSSKAKDWLDLKMKQRNELSVKIHPDKVKKLLGISTLGGVTIRQNGAGKVYFNNDTDKLYILKDFVWQGPAFKQVMRSSTNSTTVENTKKKGRMTGALLGTMIVPGAGTIIGGMVGTGNKTTKGKTQSNTVSAIDSVEVATPAYIVLEKLPSGDTVRLDFKCDSETNRVLSQFVMDKPKTAAPSLPENASVSVSSDPYEELKKLKELLDMGIVTQEEFDQKKSELLNL